MLQLKSWGPIFDRLGGGIMRWSLVFIFLAYGVLKFSGEEAAEIAPLTQHSFFLFWINPLLGVQGGSNLIGVIEIATALLIALRRPFPALSATGSLLAAGALFVTVSFLFSTPGLSPTSTDAGFLLKDVTLLGAALWSAAEALRASMAGELAPTDRGLVAAA